MEKKAPNLFYSTLFFLTCIFAFLFIQCHICNNMVDRFYEFAYYADGAMYGLAPNILFYLTSIISYFLLQLYLIIRNYIENSKPQGVDKDLYSILNRSVIVFFLYMNTITLFILDSVNGEPLLSGWKGDLDEFSEIVPVALYWVGFIYPIYYYIKLKRKKTNVKDE